MFRDQVEDEKVDLSYDQAFAMWQDGFRQAWESEGTQRLEDEHYGYLLDRAVQRLTEARLLAQQSGLTQRAILPMGGNRFMILPWEGTRVFNTLMALFDYQDIKVSRGFAPFYCEIDAASAELDELRISLHAIAANPPAAEALIADLSYENLIRNKYDRFVPENLLRKAMTRDYLDVDGALQAIETIVQ